MRMMPAREFQNPEESRDLSVKRLSLLMEFLDACPVKRASRWDWIGSWSDLSGWRIQGSELWSSACYAVINKTALPSMHLSGERGEWGPALWGRGESSATGLRK